MDIVRYLRRRWLTIKQEDGFAGLEPWAAVEIANGELCRASVTVILCSSCRRTRYQGSRRPHASVDPDLDLDPEDIPVTGFAVASNKRNQDFHELFPSVPEGDYLIEGASSPSSLRLVLRHRTNT